MKPTFKKRYLDLQIILKWISVVDCKRMDHDGDCEYLIQQTTLMFG